MKYVCVLFCIYAMWFILRTSSVVDGERYFALFDDEMISMKYAENLAHGYGLIWNHQRPDERVEGYTNLLWTLFMAGFHLLPVAKSKMSLLVEIMGAIFLLINLFFVRKISELIKKETLFPLLAVIYTAFYLPLNDWGLQGTEVSILALFVSINVFLSLQSLDSRTVPWYLYVPLGISTLVRLDAAVPFLALFVFLIVVDKDNRLKHVYTGLVTFVFFIGLQTVFRLVYYNDIFPNTYYLKMTGYPVLWRIGRGFLVLKDFLFGEGFLVMILPFLSFKAARNRSILLLMTLILAQIAYSVYVGGDAWEGRGGANRYIAIVMPLFFILLAQTLVEIKLLRNHKPVFWTVVFICFFSLNALKGPTGILKLIPRSNHGGEYVIHRVKLLEKLTTKDARVAVLSAGTLPYFLDREAIDMLGKSDRYISHLSSCHAPTLATLDGGIRNFWPGHTKYDYLYSIGQLKPDVVAQFWRVLPSDAQALLFSDYIRRGGSFYRKDSPNIKWEKLHSCFAGEE
jgi:arabinofuranosyltransferase